DRVLSPGEWDHAACKDFAVSLPGGATTPGRLCAMNDTLNLHIALRFDHGSLTIDGNTFGAEFDNDNDGLAENGDDVYLVNPGVGFVDDFRTNLPPCPPGNAEASCGPADTDNGGTVDGLGAFVD